MEIVSPPNIAGLVAENVVAALGAATVNGKKVFTVVSVVDDEASFVRVADPLAATGNCAGVIAGTVEEQDGTCDRDVLCRLPLSVLIRIERQRKPGEGENDPLKEMSRLAEIAKRAILSDRTRGGLCRLITWNGALINCTEISGRFQPVRRVTNQAFFTASLPVTCGWIISR